MKKERERHGKKLKRKDPFSWGDRKKKGRG